MLFSGSSTRLLLILLSFSACTSARVDRVVAPSSVTAPTTFNHGLFDAVLQAHVTDGYVDYAGLQASDALTPYLAQLAATDPSALSREGQLAFWMNAYNALTLKLVVDNYPTASILRLSPVGIRGIPFVIPRVNSPFEVKVGEVGGQVRTLDEIEHDIIRPQFNEPRIHFAIVCAAVSCPPLRSEAYVADRLDEQLEDQARIFLNNPDKNRIPARENKVEVSKIFKWFKEDFGDSDQALQAFLAPYFEGEVAAGLREGAYDVGYTSYDWSLNDQAELTEPVADDR
ncbi:MAG: DUF547 domain-containing protein [Bacteroidota bacterium]